MYVHSIPNNNDNQDIVSMGTNSALITQRVINNAFQVMAIQLLSIIQAVDYLSIGNELSPRTKKAYASLRAVVPRFVEDTSKYKEIDSIINYIKENCIDDML
ncbi:MAG: aromatic amino acid lyase [Bacteroidales bacterium]